MPTIEHEAVVQVLNNEPHLIAMLLENFGVRLPSGSAAVIADSNLSDRDPERKKSLTADNVIVFQGTDGKIAVIAEVQTEAPDHSRALAWPAYACIARSRHGCDVILMVIGLNRDAVRGSARTIRTGHPGFDLTPLVTGHGRLPGAGGPEFGPELTVLNVITGDLDMTIHEARMLALVNIASASPERRESYTRIIRAVISEPARAALEELMKTVIKDPFLDGLIARGKMIGAARILLQILPARGIAVPDDVRARIGECTDTDQLEAWAVRAATASTLEDVFGQ